MLPVLRSRNVVILVSCVLSLKSYRQTNTLTKTDHIVTNALKTNCFTQIWMRFLHSWENFLLDAYWFFQKRNYYLKQRTEHCKNYNRVLFRLKQILWNRPRFFVCFLSLHGPSLKMDVAFELGHWIKPLILLLVANGIALPIKTALWFY